MAMTDAGSASSAAQASTTAQASRRSRRRAAASPSSPSDAHAAGFVTPIALDRDTFMRRLIASLGHLNEGILGSDVAGAYIVNVGLSMGAAIEEEYKRFWGIEDRPFTIDEYAHVIVDLKRKIQGNFSLVSKSDEKVVVSTTSCPFDAFVRQSPSLCFMTSSVFGGIAARNFGWAKTVLHRRIALGDPNCYVTVYLRRTPEAVAAVGREYFPDVERASPDIAEQLRLMDNLRRLQRRLSEMHSRWEEVVRGAADAIALLDGEGLVAFANARWRDLLGVEADELTGARLESVLHPDDAEGTRAAWEAALGGTRSVGVPARLQHRTGEWRDVTLSVGPVRDESGGVAGALAIAHDVTIERETQRLKDDFLSTAAHELRTPVTTIRTITEVLLRTLERDGALDAAQLTRRLQVIQRQADQLALVGTDLVDVSRVQQGKLQMRPERADLREIAAAAVERQRERLTDSRTIERHPIVVRPADRELPVLVEQRRIEQILANLLENAVKYSPDGGTIVVSTGAQGPWARVSVQDSGIGIPAADLPHVFTPFYRGSNASSRHYSGLGFGLYLSRSLAEVHGGELSVQSAEGAGATFTLSLPLADLTVPGTDA